MFGKYTVFFNVPQTLTDILFGTPFIQVKWSLLLGRRRTDVSAYRLQDGLSQGPRGFGINVQ